MDTRTGELITQDAYNSLKPSEKEFFVKPKAKDIEKQIRRCKRVIRQIKQGTYYKNHTIDSLWDDIKGYQDALKSLQSN